jgi:hypothetical protein
MYKCKIRSELLFLFIKTQINKKLTMHSYSIET